MEEARTKNLKKFLDFLGQAEGADYDTIVGSTPKAPKKFTDFTAHPRVVGLVTKDGPSTAAGKYQITKTTYDDFAPKLGIKDFSPASQDKLALAIIQKEGALDDVAAGNFDAAINKLGGRWASLPSSQYQQSKRSPEWVAKSLSGTTASPAAPLQGTVADPATLRPTQSVGQRDLLVGDLQKEQKYDGVVNTVKQIPTAISYGFQNENNAYNFLKEKGAGNADPEFTMTREKFKLATEGVDENHHDYLLAAHSDDDLARRKDRLKQATDRQQELSNMGFVGFMGSMAGTVLDVDTILSAVPVAGSVGMAHKAGRLATAVKTGLAAGTINAGVEYTFGDNRPTFSDSDVYMAGLFGLGLGGVGGALKRTGHADFDTHAKNVEDYARAQLGKLQKQEIEDAGLTVTERGKKILDLEVRDDPLVDVPTQKVREEQTAVWERTSPNSGHEPTIGSAGAGTLRERPALSGRQLMKDITETGSPEEKLLAARLMEQLPDDLSVYRVPKKDLHQGSRAYYDPGQHAVFIGRDSNTSTQLHEVAHAVTVHKIDYGLRNPTSAHGVIAKEIEGLYMTAKRTAKEQGFDSYFLKDIHEFTAGLYGGTGRDKFVDFLSKIKVEDDNVFGKLVDAIRKVLGMNSKETNAFLKSLDLTDKLADTRLNVTLTRARSGERYTPGARSFRLDGDDPDFHPAPGKPSEGFWQGPAYENFFNREWVPDDIKSFVRSIFGSTTGYKDHSVVSQSAMDQKKALAGQWQNQFAKTLQPALREYLIDMQVPFRQKSAALQEWNESLGDFIRGVPGNYHPTIQKVGGEWRRLSRDVVDNINNPGKFNGDIKKGLTQIEVMDHATGVKKLSDPLDYNDNYLPRIQDVLKEKTLIAQYGLPTVERFVGNMFRAANSKISQPLADKLGKWYLRTVEEAKLNRETSQVDSMLRGFDRVAFKDSLIKNGNLLPHEADAVISSMHRNPDSEAAGMLNGNLKRRSVLDETYTETIVQNGQSHKLTYRDLFDTDTVGNISNYFNKQAGSIALAHHTDLYDVRVVKEAVSKLLERDWGSKVTDDQQRKLAKHLNDILDITLGRPLEDFSTFSKSMQMVADYNILTKAGLFVLNQITETAQMLGSPMWKSILRTVPEMGTLVRDTKTGKVNNEVIDALENLSGGPGTAMLRDNPITPGQTWVREKGDTKFNQWLDKADHTLGRGAQNLFKFTGMSGVTAMQQRSVAVAFVNHFVDHAMNGKTVGYSADRLAWMGLSAGDTKAVVNGIKAHHKAGKGKLGEVDFNAWAQNDPKSFSKFIVAYQRESARVVQENDLASMVPIMGKTVGKVVFQFMGFPLHAWNKSMLFAANHRDLSTLNTVMYAIGINALAYLGRTQLQMSGMSDAEKQQFAGERLSTSQIVLNAVGRVPQMSVAPMMYDTMPFAPPLFSGMRTTTGVSDFVGGNPTLSTISSGLSMTKKLTRNAASSDHQTTERDVKALFRLAPFNNVVGVSNMLSSVAADFPTQEKTGD